MLGKIRQWDISAVVLSVLCTVHCLAAPILISVSPMFGSEVFHVLLLVLVIPVSLVALPAGYKRHGNRVPLIVGVLGMALMTFAVVLGPETLGIWGERAVTMVGAVILGISHFHNLKLRRTMLKAA